MHDAAQNQPKRSLWCNSPKTLCNLKSFSIITPLVCSLEGKLNDQRKVYMHWPVHIHFINTLKNADLC